MLKAHRKLFGLFGLVISKSFDSGVGRMSFQKFTAYNIGGAVLWSTLFVGAGALLGNIPAVKHNFSIVGLKFSLHPRHKDTLSCKEAMYRERMYNSISMHLCASINQDEEIIMSDKLGGNFVATVSSWDVFVCRWSLQSLGSLWYQSCWKPLLPGRKWRL